MYLAQITTLSYIEFVHVKKYARVIIMFNDFFACEK